MDIEKRITSTATLPTHRHIHTDPYTRTHEGRCTDREEERECGKWSGSVIEK